VVAVVVLITLEEVLLALRDQAAAGQVVLTLQVLTVLQILAVGQVGELIDRFQARMAATAAQEL
jgi:hypothetical protein